MKKIIIILLVLQSFTAFSQFSDNFNDGLFQSNSSSNRTVDWVGNTDDFIVNESLQLQLNSPNNQSPAQLRTQSSMISNTRWEFYVRMDFNPTASNYSRVYIVSDEENLTGDLNGLFIRIGYSDKNICLIQSQKGKNNKTLIQGEKRRLDNSSVAMNIRATLDDSGNFNLYSKLDEETSFTLEGSCTMDEITTSSWFGVVCTFTTTRNKLFFFDNFVVQDIDNDNPIEEPIDEPTPTYDLPQEGDILFSEIMANPGTGSENPEYIELYNASDKTFQLNNCLFYYGDRSYRLPDKIISPKTYFILCKTTETGWFDETVNTTGVPSFPTLANGGRLLMLENNKGELISWFEYSDSMYGDNTKKGGGWSLECKDLSNLSNTADNWSASVSETGGSPGKENSIKSTYPDSETPKILSSLLLEENKIDIAFSKPMNRSSLLKTENYFLENENYQIIDLETNYPQGTQLIIQLNKFPPKGELLELDLVGIQDLSGNKLGNNASLFVGSGYEAEKSEIIINEILFNPPTGGNEYVELYNRSDKVIDLRLLSITSRRPSDGSFNRAYPLTALPLFLYPEEYVVITKSQELVCNFFDCRDESFFLEPENMPSLANASGCAVILNNVTNEVVDEFYYSESMHSSGISNKKGVALERVSFGKATNESSNWLSASAQSKYGTPGYLNSHHLEDTAIDNVFKNTIKIEYPHINNESYGINYQLDKSGYNCRIFVYDTVGRMVDTIINNETLGSQGTIYWNGKGKSNYPLSSGIYILYMEIFDTSGNVHKFKTPITVK